jgi:mono/diheme cytochrome c family protein
LTDRQVEIIALGLKPRWQAKSVKAEDYPPYLLPAGIAGNPADAEKTFKAACASCHGEQGQGSKTVDRTIGAINNWPYLALSSDQVLRRYIITGRPDLGMPSCIEAKGRPSEFKPLTSNEVTAVTNLLIEWREKSAMGR